MTQSAVIIAGTKRLIKNKEGHREHTLELWQNNEQESSSFPIQSKGLKKKKKTKLN